MSQIVAIVFDWAGTTIDYGCIAPARVFQEVFARRGVPITEAQAREPMGSAKRDHIARIAGMDDVSSRWQQTHGNQPTMTDVDQMYADFLPLQLEILGEYTELIPGTVDVIDGLKKRGIKIGSSTGYTRELMSVVIPAAEQQGYSPDCVICSDDVRHGRPTPFMLYEALHRMNAYPVWKTIKVDDTLVGIEAGKNAGAWTVAVTKTGNQLGLDRKTTEAMSESELRSKLTKIAADFEAIGADYIIDGIEQLPGIVEIIEQRVAAGDSISQVQ